MHDSESTPRVGVRPPDEPASTDGEDPRVSALMAQIAERLRPVCRAWEEDAFRALVRQIAELELRWQARDGKTSRRSA